MKNDSVNPIFRLDSSFAPQNHVTFKKQIVPVFPAHSHTYYELTYYPASECVLNINAIPQRNDIPLAVLITPADFHSFTKSDGKNNSLQFAFNDTLIPNVNILPECAVVLECKENSDYIKGLFEELSQNTDNLKYASFLISTIILKLKLCGHKVSPNLLFKIHNTAQTPLLHRAFA